MQRVSVLPPSEWAKSDTGNPDRYWLRNPLTGNLHNPNTVPPWVDRSRGISALRHCTSVVRFVVEPASNHQQPNARAFTELAKGITVAGWAYGAQEKTICTTGLVALATNARTFNTKRSVRDSVAEETRNTILKEASCFTKAARRQPRNQNLDALSWAARVHGVDALGWSMLVSAGEAVLDEWEMRDGVDADIGVIIGVTPTYIDVVAKAGFLGLAPERIQTRLIGPEWEEPEASGAFMMTDMLRAGVIDAENLV